MVLRPGNIAIRFDEKSFISTILGFTQHWDYKHYNEYISKKIVKLSTTNEIDLNCDVIDGSLVNGSRQPILYSFVLDKPAGHKFFSRPELVHYKKINESVSNTITFYLDDNHEVDFDQEVLTFTTVLVKV